MRVWTQVIAGVIVLAGGAAMAARFVPGADAALVNAGVPASLVSAVSGNGGGEKAATAGAPQGQGAASGQGGNRRGGGPIVVTLAPVSTGIVNDRLQAIGDGEAITSVTVMPQVSGMIAKVEVQSGASVKAGAVLARLDDASEQIAVNTAKLALKSAEDKLVRLRGLRSAVTRVEVEEAERAVDGAKLALETANLNLSRKVITAPISGVAGIVPVNPGDNVTTQTAIVAIDDRSEILVDFWVPERFASAIAVGAEVEASATARPGEVFTGSVAAIDNRIDAASRTIRVRARIPNEKDELRAGMSFSVAMKFEGETYPSVVPLAIQWDSKGSYIWRQTDGKAERVPVRIIQRNPENVLVEAALAEGDAIVSEGMQRVRPGAEIATARASAEAKP